jgi:hypothetical protein
MEVVVNALNMKRLYSEGGYVQIQLLSNVWKLTTGEIINRTKPKERNILYKNKGPHI